MNKLNQILKYYRKYYKLFLITILSAIVLAGVSLLIPMGIRYITKDILAENLAHAPQALIKAGSILSVVIMLYTLSSMAVSYYGHMLGANMENDMRKELFGKLQTLSYSFYDENKVGELLTRLTYDLQNLSEMFHHVPENIFIAGIRFFGAIIILATINVPLTIFMTVLLTGLIIYALYRNKKLYDAMFRHKEEMSKLNAHVEDNLAGIRVVQSFANEDFETEKFITKGKSFIDTKKDIYRNEVIFYEGVEGYIQFITLATVIFGGFQIVGGQMDLSDLLAFILYIANFTGPIEQLMYTSQMLQDGMTGFNRFKEIMELTPAITEVEYPLIPEKIQGSIVMKHVDFEYGSSNQVLDDINLAIKPGEYVALVGPSGVGKSTICSLIPRFYDVSNGNIQIDGVDLKDYSLEALRKNIGVVSQNVFLFAGTIEENIAYGKPDATRDEIVEAAKKANAHEFIEKLPNGYGTDVGERGVKLSGGQKQRISLARVFLKNPPIFIFDEATSALDNESEMLVQQALENIASNRTTIVIAHRLSTIKNADHIIVMDAGKIIEEGTHDELITQHGNYRKMYEINL